MNISCLSCGLDMFECTEIKKKIFQETFRDSNIELTVVRRKTLTERTTSGDHNTASTNNQHWNQSSSDLDTQATSSFLFPPTGSPSQCMEALESF